MHNPSSPVSAHPAKRYSTQSTSGQFRDIYAEWTHHLAGLLSVVSSRRGGGCLQYYPVAVLSRGKLLSLGSNIRQLCPRTPAAHYPRDSRSLMRNTVYCINIT